MQRKWQQFVAISAAFAIAGVAWAQQQNPQVVPDRDQAQPQRGEVQPAPRQQQDDRRDVTARRVNPEAGAVRAFRSSRIVGMTVRNMKNENIGRVNDIVLDLEERKIRYVAVSHGGFLGLGDKLFAIPADAFQLREDQTTGWSHLVLDVDESVFENSPGFDQNNWPNHADERFARHGTTETPADRRDGTNRNEVQPIPQN